MLKDKQLPSGVTKYKETNTFTSSSVPKGFLKDHATKAEVWGLLIVRKGSVTYVDTASAEERDIHAGSNQVIEPESRHYIRPSDDAEFHVEFHQSASDNASTPHKGKPLF